MKRMDPADHHARDVLMIGKREQPGRIVCSMCKGPARTWVDVHQVGKAFVYSFCKTCVTRMFAEVGGGDA